MQLRASRGLAEQESVFAVAREEGMEVGGLRWARRRSRARVMILM